MQEGKAGISWGAEEGGAFLRFSGTPRPYPKHFGSLSTDPLVDNAGDEFVSNASTACLLSCGRLPPPRSKASSPLEILTLDVAFRLGLTAPGKRWWVS